MPERSLARDALISSPVRLARLRAELSQQELAKLSGVDRHTVRALEAAGTAGSDATFRQLERVLSVRAGSLEADHTRWYDRLDALMLLGARQKAILNLPPGEITRSYGSFREWRCDLLDSAVEFGILTRLATGTVTAYEKGATKRFPVSLQSALMTRLRLSPGYVEALAVLPAHDGEE